MNIELSPTEKTELELRHQRCRDKRESDRIKAVLLSSEGWTVWMISQALRKHESTIKRHLSDYQAHQKLKPTSGGSKSFLSAAQTLELIAHLTEHTYLCQPSIIAHIESTYGVRYSVPGLNKWLHQNGFSYKKPKGVPHKFDPLKQSAFIEHYAALKDGLGSTDTLLFMDAVHPTQATKITSGWIRRGQDKAIKTSGSRTRLNVLGAIRLGHLHEAIVEQYERVNGETIVDFLGLIKERYETSKRIHLVLDGAGYHVSKEVKKTAADLGITLHYLPPYSPNLNPIERLWKVMNKYARDGRYFATSREFRERIRSFFDETLPKISGTLNTTITDNFQRLTPA